MTLPSGLTRTEYYDVKTKLLVRREETKAANNMSVTTTVDFTDYKKTGDLLYPWVETVTIAANGQQQTMEMKASDVKINEGVSNADFQ